MHVQTCHGKSIFFSGLHTKLQEKIAHKQILRKKNNPQFRKRGNKNLKSKILKVFGINAAGIKSKMDSFNEVLSVLKPQIWMVEETKLKPHENIRCGNLSDFQVFYLSRQESQGGG